MSDETQSWHLDKRVPVALILTLLVQFATGVWFLSAAFKDIASNTKSIDGVTAQIESVDRRSGARLDRIETNAGTQAVQLGRIEENVSGMRNDMNRLINLLDRTKP